MRLVSVRAIRIVSPFQSTHPLRGATKRWNFVSTLASISIHAPLAGCDKHGTGQPRRFTRFQSTHPLRGATIKIKRTRTKRSISIHAPLAGCDPLSTYPPALMFAFQSTHPLRGATASLIPCSLSFAISIHAPLAGCDVFSIPSFALRQISIHAPLAGCDHLCPSISRRYHTISIHAPLAGCDLVDKELFDRICISIHAPLAGCDLNLNIAVSHRLHFNPRTPCGVRRIFTRQTTIFRQFQSTHPLRGATSKPKRQTQSLQFQSTHPLRGATRLSMTPWSRLRNFNPRTPCGVRPELREVNRRYYDFNPRTPCGVRPLPFNSITAIMRFQSTHPLRGATKAKRLQVRFLQISIHAPLAGCDSAIAGVVAGIADFNPRTPCGVRPPSDFKYRKLFTFQSTHPLRGATLYAVWHIKLHPHQRADQSKNKL